MDQDLGSIPGCSPCPHCKHIGALNRHGYLLLENLRKLRLLLEDFPKNHNLILVGQVELLSNLDLAVNQDIKEPGDLFGHHQASA